MFKSVLIGFGAGFLGLAATAIVPIVVGILGAVGGAVAVVGLAAWRAFKRRGRDAAPETTTAS